MALKWLLLLVLILILLNRPTRIQDLMKSLGQAVKNYKDKKDEIEVFAKKPESNSSKRRS